VPLLTREQEVEISKRIEAAENEFRRIICSLGFAAKEHIALAEKLVCKPPKERFDRVIVDQKIDSRDLHVRAIENDRALDLRFDRREIRVEIAAVRIEWVVDGCEARMPESRINHGGERM
jgi:hypothetical protein